MLTIESSSTSISRLRTSRLRLGLIRFTRDSFGPVSATLFGGSGGTGCAAARAVGVERSRGRGVVIATAVGVRVGFSPLPRGGSDRGVDGDASRGVGVFRGLAVFVGLGVKDGWGV